MPYLTYSQLATLARHFTAGITDKEVAATLKVSKQAVSKALNGKPGMIKLLRLIIETYSEFGVSDEEFYRIITGNSETNDENNTPTSHPMGSK